MKLVFLVVCLSVLSNCSSSGDGGTTLVQGYSGTKNPTSALRGEDVTATYNAASDTFSITIEGRTIDLTSDAIRSRSGNVGVWAFSDSRLTGREFPEFVAYRLVSSSGNTTATLAAKSGSSNIPGHSPVFLEEHFGAGYSRESTTVIPTSGSATMNGQYVGVVSGNRLVGGHPGNNISDDVIYGDVTLTADFNTGTVNGSITNRVSYDLAIMELNNNETVDDVILSNVSIANDGTYSGDISGGGINRNGNLTGTTGSYSGVISGVSGTETAGLVSIIHRYTGVPFGLYEEGIFVAQ